MRRKEVVVMVGFKAFDKDLKCRGGFQYEIGHTYKFDGEPISCRQGFHFCKNIADTYKYYPMDNETRICKIEALGEIHTDDGMKFCTNEIKIIEEIEEEWVRKGNSNSSSLGYLNTGGYNSGGYNSGNRNSGHRNSGPRNSGSGNSGIRNSGNGNSGDCNSGDWNTGHHNSGDRNSGYCNSGHANSGSRNSGNYNSGSHNSGNHNSGHWNSGDHSSGCFNTKEECILMFNKPSKWHFHDWAHSHAFYVLRDIPNGVVEWIKEEDMSESEKEENPSYKTTGGYLKILDDENAAQYYWDGLSEKEKEAIYNLPNFDKDIFKECTGIEV